MIAADREYAKSAQQVQITGAIAVEQVLPLPFLEPNIVSDRFENAYQLFVQMPGVHGTALTFALHKHLGNVKIGF
jgi:hypothetical protein